jgi:hypothetical protein
LVVGTGVAVDSGREALGVGVGTVDDPRGISGGGVLVAGGGAGWPVTTKLLWIA